MRNNVILLNTNNSIVVSMIDFGASLSRFEFQFHSIQFCRSVMSNSLQPHGLQHDSPPCPSLTPGVYSNSSTLSQWCHPTISSSVVPFSSHLQSFPASGSFPMSQFSTSVPLLTSYLTLDKRLTLCAEIILCSNLTPLSFLSLWKKLYFSISYRLARNAMSFGQWSISRKDACTVGPRLVWVVHIFFFPL